MKQHAMTHKFRDAMIPGDSNSPPPHDAPSVTKMETESAADRVSPATAAVPLSSALAGVNQSPEEPAHPVSMTGRPPEKRAILCG